MAKAPNKGRTVSSERNKGQQGARKGNRSQTEEVVRDDEDLGNDTPPAVEDDESFDEEQDEDDGA